MPDADKPKPLYLETLLQMVRNSVGTAMFRSFFVQATDGKQFDALDDGDNSCAFYVSSVLVILKQIGSAHATVSSLVKDLETSGWQKVDQPRSGDVIIWQAAEFADGIYEHVGFYIGEQRAVSTSSKTRLVAEHDLDFGELKRPIKQLYRKLPGSI